jgi:tricorn protease
MKKRFSFLFLMVGAATAQQETLLLRQPAISAKNIAFAYGGDLWVANRDGSNPRRLTVSPTGESAPWFSPDGNWITFTGTYDNNTDVYVISVNGGLPKRLTFHPGADQARGLMGRKCCFCRE